jgi:uncharacterized protein YdaT
MPWTGESFKQKHNQGLTPEQADRAARIANAVLDRDGDEASAIRIANAAVKQHPPQNKSVILA